MLAESQQPGGNNSAASELGGQRTGTGSAAPVAVVREGEPWDGRRSPTDIQLLKLLKRLNTGVSPLPPFIHKLNTYSTAPEDLVKGRRQAPGTGHGREGSYYFHSVKATSGKGGKRTRKVGGEDGTWHPEAGAKPILGADGESVVAYKRTFSYTIRSPHPPGMQTASRRRQRTGWIMVEISLEEHSDGAEADHMVLCVVHKSKHKYTGTPMAAGQEAARASDEKVHESLDLPTGDLLSPAPSIDTACTTTTKLLLHKAVEKAASFNFETASKIHEFVQIKELHLGTIDQLGLDRSIVSGTLDKLEVLLEDIAIIKALTPDERENVVSCGEDMSTTICHAYLNVLVKRLQQEFGALEKIGFNVHGQVSQKASKVMNVSLVVHDSEGKQCVQVLYSACGLLPKVEGAENERPLLPVDSSSSGEKRKAAHDHPEAPPSVRQELTDTDHSFLQEVELRLLSDSNDPVSSGADNVGDHYKIFEDIINEDEHVPTTVEEDDIVVSPSFRPRVRAF